MSELVSKQSVYTDNSICDYFKTHTMYFIVETFLGEIYDSFRESSGNIRKY